MSASVNLPLHHKVQKFSSGTGSPGWSRKKGRKTVVVWWYMTAMRRCMLHGMASKERKLNVITTCGDENDKMDV